MLQTILFGYQIVAFLCLGLGMYLAVLVLISDPKKTLNRLFLFLVLTSATYTTVPYFANLPEFSHYSLWIIRLAYGMAPFAGLFGYFFAINLPGKEKIKHRYRFLSILAVSIALFSFFVGLSPFFIKNLEITEWGVSPVFGEINIKLLYFFSVFFFALVVALVSIRNYIAASKEEKSRYLYFLIGFILCFPLISGIFLVILPMLGYYPSAQWYLPGISGAIFLYIFTAIAIIKKEAFGVRIILPQILAGLTNIFILILFLIEKSLFVKSVTAIIFILALFINALLIISVQNEIKEKEKSKKLSDELANLNRVLEERVKERTKEVQQKAAELEKFYRLTVGRELRMVELKKKIRELEEKMKREE